MKKILLGLTILLTLTIGLDNVNASSKVTVYLFRGSTCEHCENALEYMDKHRDEIPKDVEIVTYEVWENKNNSKLQDAVADKLKVDKKENYGVPFIVIGEKYIKGYGGASTFKEMMDIAKNYIDDVNYKDVVLTTTSGDVKVSSAEHLEVRTISGDVDVNNILGYVNISTTSGSVNIERLEVLKNSVIKSVSGDVEIERCNTVYVDAKTTSGDIDIYENSRLSDIVLNITTVSGDIEVN